MPDYILSKVEVQTVCKHYLVTKQTVETLKIFIGQLCLSEDEVNRLKPLLNKIDVALSELKSLAHQLYCLQEYSEEGN
jgi:hypothetical protein